MISYYDTVYDKAMTQSLTEPDKKKAAALVLKVFHETVCPQLQKHRCLRPQWLLFHTYVVSWNSNDDQHPKKFTKVVFCCS